MHKEAKRNASRILVGKPVGKGVLVRPRHRWGNNIKIGAMEIGLHRVD
jgi:hypothetical protein